MLLVPAQRLLRALSAADPFRRRGLVSTRTLVSPLTLARPRGKALYWTVFTGVVLLFALAFLFPVYWMVTGAMKSPTSRAHPPEPRFPNTGASAATPMPGT